MSVAAAVEGPGLHTGARGVVRFVRHDGPVVLRAGGIDTPICDLRVVGTARSTTIATADGGVRVATIEHVFAALGGLGIHAGVAVVVDGREPPLADGAARIYCDMLTSLAVASSAPPLRVVRAGVIEIHKSSYELRPNEDDAQEPVAIEVEIDFDDARIAKRAHWNGDAADFRARIAVARTFGFEHELEALLGRGLASHVTPESVIVIGEGRIMCSGAPFSADEPVRHKLLDLIGDLYLYGGPPRGGLRAIRPGHAATHEVMRRALDQGLVVRDVR